MSMKLLLIFTVLLFLSSKVSGQARETDSTYVGPNKIAYVAPIQLIAGVGIYSAVFLGVFERYDLLDHSPNAADIGAGLAIFASIGTSALLVHGVGNILIGDGFEGYIWLTLAAGLAGGVSPWKIMPRDSGNWRVLNRAIPPAFCATAAYTLQSLLLPCSPVRINPLVGRYVGLGFEWRY
jgi:hypothetical protein